ncbi:SPX-domain containing nucleotidyltransferase [Fragilariopsis cylindrus CCMP1102]|uniref:SPX-domain containing nucleotidyltransferase n=1 Tax=Fragilariopsis cylindrus CCMP1102 TaxID=635003 RepID=A0A1E7EVB1_9STRA|nr:SPX-domain containing nucleotidyltransferase [Fragilariopsis cylindrus CCMP1102]|eukprot:OEU09960.1 SPX-domain containing nucleotidyltransferase [Fragilariopsis cylindrus CCMP1102]
MKFGKTLAERTLKEWRFYYVDYKELKKTIKKAKGLSIPKKELRTSFDAIIDNSEEKLSQFYHDKLSWATSYITTLEKRVEDLRESASEPGSPTSSLSSDASAFSIDFDTLSGSSPTGIADNLQIRLDKLSMHEKRNGDGAYLKDAYRRMGASKHFQDYIYAKKSLVTFAREIDLLLEFLEINKTAYYKILKKFDKHTGSNLLEERLEKILERNAFLNGVDLRNLKNTVQEYIDEISQLKPRLPNGWENRKVYTIGCFDLFHRGHQNVLLSLREFGAYVINLKPFADQIYVIPSTDPLQYIQSMVSDQDIANGSCCYARGDDMLNFPSREWVESVMPVHFVPRTEACSSTLIRTIYHADSDEIRQKAAFAKTRYDGKPIDENGNVLKLYV